SKKRKATFTNKRRPLLPRLRLYGTTLENVSEVKYLGLIFDRKMSWKSHVNSVIDSCKSSLNVIKMIAHQD
ncbi:hypothetical protein PPYR_15675, partial [Photinus pyralis]